ncbi:MAG: hypothetical protein Q4F88_05250 [Eubacteriales bacterium]|nr:hypothetical protein [Eubacteriales bacterium]
MNKEKEKKLDLIISILFISIVFCFRFFNSHKDYINNLLISTKYPDKVKITSCFLEKDRIYINANSNGKYNKNYDDNYYLLEYEPFEDGSESKRYISMQKKNIELSFNIPLTKDEDPRRYYGDRIYNRFGICIWNNEKYILVSNLISIGDYDLQNNNELNNEKNIIKLENHNDDINIVIVNPYSKEDTYLIKEYTTIRDYYEYYVPNVYERNGYEQIKESLERIFAYVNNKYKNKKINWYFGKNINSQYTSYLARSDLNEYVKKLEISYRVFYYFFKQKNETINFLINTTIKDNALSNVEYESNKFLNSFSNSINKNGAIKIYYSDNITNLEYINICDFTKEEDYKTW